LFDTLDDPHGDEADELDQREDVDAHYPEVAQVDVVWHQYDQQAIVELQADNIV